MDDELEKSVGEVAVANHKILSVFHEEEVQVTQRRIESGTQITQVRCWK